MQRVRLLLAQFVRLVEGPPTMQADTGMGWAMKELGSILNRWIEEQGEPAPAAEQSLANRMAAASIFLTVPGSPFLLQEQKLLDLALPQTPDVRVLRSRVRARVGPRVESG